MTASDRPALPTADPDEFPRPPLDVEDDDGDAIALRRYGEGQVDDAFEALVAMYVDFSPAHRAQGIPPIGRDRVERWLEQLLDGVDVVAWHGERAVGHATLVSAEDVEWTDDQVHELAIFVHQSHQGRGIGKALMRALLGAAADDGVECVWLTVERWNDAAVGLYRSVGFEYLDPDSFEMEMGLRLVD